MRGEAHVPRAGGWGLRGRWVALFMVLAVTANASTVLPDPGFTPGSGVSMKLTNFYEDIPPSGFLPLRVEVKNSTDAARKWVFRSTQSQSGSSAMDFTTEIHAEAMSEQTVDLLIPITPQAGNSSRYSSMQIFVSGYGVAEGRSNLHSPGTSGTPTPYFGMGGELSVKNWGPLTDLVKKRGSRTLDGTKLEVNMMPSDWRGLAGFQIILFTAAEWRALPAGSRGALLDWVAQGGRLLLGYEVSSARPDLPPAGAVGVGTIEHWAIDELLVSRLDSLLDGGPDSTAEIVRRDYNWDWEPARDIGRPEPPQLMILLFVICFAVIIGPVNFFVFAPAGERHRLFWTTPLISVTASLLMGLFIFFSEGVGGSGRRFVVMLSLGGQNRSVIWQEQISRTGVLLANSFPLSDPASVLLPIRLSDGNPAHTWRQSSHSYSLTGPLWGGDWFRSRRTQAQAVVTVTPSRGRLEFATGVDGKPVVVSTFENEMGEIWYFDPVGQPWKGTRLGPGEKVTLARAEAKEFNRWLKETLTPAGALTGGQVQSFAKSERAGKFFATATAPGLIASLSSIRWKDGPGLVFGRTTP